MSSTITIYTKDENTVLSGNAVKDDGITKYLQSELTTVKILYTDPIQSQTYAKITATMGAGGDTDNSFTATITGTLPIRGYWGFQMEYVLASSGKPVYSKIFYKYVSNTITAT